MERQTILLVGGDKSDDWTGWYKVNIPIANDRFDEHQDKITERRRTDHPSENGIRVWAESAAPMRDSSDSGGRSGLSSPCSQSIPMVLIWAFQSTWSVGVFPVSLIRLPNGLPRPMP
jgi:hypothetical protein